MKNIEFKRKKGFPRAAIAIICVIVSAAVVALGFILVKKHIEKSDAKAYMPENGAIRLPFSSLPGVGESAALGIVSERKKEPFFSVEDLQIRAKLNKSVLETLRNAGVFKNIQETDQLSMF